MESNLYCCNLCNITYKQHKKWKEHSVICSIKHINVEDIKDSESILTPLEMTKIICILTKQCRELMEEVSKLKKNQYTQKKKYIMEYLTEPRFKLDIVFSEWITRIRPTRENLLVVFEFDLMDGIKSIISPYLTNISEIPICAFKQKPNTIYVYEKNATTQNNEWRVMDIQELKRVINKWANLLLVEFLDWQDENETLFQIQPQKKEESIIYSSKITGNRKSEESRCSEIKQWIVRKIEQSIPNIE
jgi:nicotinic acid phosphoribosyltransferase